MSIAAITCGRVFLGIATGAASCEMDIVRFVYVNSYIYK
jgi:hypothetical protein